jgi:hypothetical protein
MAQNSRTIRIWVALIASMSIGAVVLMALDKNCPSAGAFSLASYTRLDPVEKIVTDVEILHTHAWNRAEICFSDTAAGGIEDLSKLSKVEDGQAINFHFIICNGVGAKDGLVESTNRWKEQMPAMPEKEWYGSPQTIRICVIGDGVKVMPTDAQLKRTSALVETLSRKFSIDKKHISYPANWQM